VYSSSQTALGNHFQSLVTGILYLVEIRDVDFVVIGAFGVRVCLQLGPPGLDGQDVEHLRYEL
jgi:hypothetical protein